MDYITLTDDPYISDHVFINKLEAIFFALPAVFFVINRIPYFVIFTLLAILFIRLSKFSFELKLYRIHLLLFTVYLYFLTSYLFSVQSIGELFKYEFFRWDGNFFFAYLPIFIYSLKRDDIRPLFIKFLLISSSIIASLGIVEYLLHGNLFGLVRTDLGLKMFVGLHMAHNAAGSFYGIISIISLCFALFSKPKINFKYLIIFIVCFLAFLLTKSRGTLITIMPILLLCIHKYTSSYKKTLMVCILVMGLLYPFLSSTGIRERMFSLMETDHYAVASRLTLWDTAIAHIKNSPLLGIGFGRFDDSVRGALRYSGIPHFIYFAVGGNVIHTDSHAHQSYLHFLAETGIIGLGLVLLFWHRFLKFLRRAKQRVPINSFDYAFITAVTFSIYAVFLMSFTEHYLSAPAVMLLLCSLCGLSLSYAKNLADNTSDEPTKF